jgi:hypothetical protein
MPRALALAAVLLFAIALAAQNERITAHPQDLPHTNTGQMTPFGDLSSACEGRSQLLLYPMHLPGPGATLIGIEVFAMVPATTHYQSLTITLSPFPPSLARSQDFAANLPVPTTVLQLTNQSVTWTTSSWHRFTATTPYVHDGTSGLTIDIQKDATPGTVAAAGVCMGLYRPDLETMLIAAGGPGSGLAQAVTATIGVLPIDLRLVWTSAPASRLRSPIPGSGHHGFALGSTLDHIVAAAPGSLYVLAGDLQWSQPVTLPFALGQWWAQGVNLGADLVGTNGESVRTFQLPGLVQYLNTQVTFQALVLDVPSAQLSWTNGSDCFLGQ